MSADNIRESRKAKKERRKSLLWLTEAQAALTWGVLLTLAALVGAIYLYQTSRIATTGRQVQLLQGELDTIKQENIELERDIAEAQSLDRLQREATSMGFTRSSPSDVEYLIVPNYPPTPESTEALQSAQPVEPVESMSEALWLAIQSSIGDLIHGKSP